MFNLGDVGTNATMSLFYWINGWQHSGWETSVHSVTLRKGLRDRRGEDAACSRLLLEAIAQHCGIPSPLRPSPTNPAAYTHSRVAEDDVNATESSALVVACDREQSSAHMCANREAEADEVAADVEVEAEVVESYTVRHHDPLERVYSGATTHALFFPRSTAGNAAAASNNTASSTASSACQDPVGGYSTAELSDGASDSATCSEELRKEFTVLESAQVPAGSVIYSGSFNPLHRGHVQLALAAAEAVAAERLGGSSRDSGSASAREHRLPLVVFELAAVNADKPPLPRAEVLRRLRQFDPATNPLLRQLCGSSGSSGGEQHDCGLDFAVAVTARPLFVQKAQLFQGCVFAVGADTLTRLVNPEYYGSGSAKSNNCRTSASSGPAAAAAEGQDPLGGRMMEADKKVSNMVAALSSIQHNSCSFVVGGRIRQQQVSTAAAVAPVASSDVFETCESILQRQPLHSPNSSSSSSSVGQCGAAGTEVMLVRDVLPDQALRLFRGLSEQQFRIDLSSTQLRKHQQEAKPPPEQLS